MAGGKNVLVQLMFQPIVPETKIQGRKINAFFRKKRLPAYVLLEWKLDGAGGYLLTGIGMVSAEVSGIEDEKNRVKFLERRSTPAIMVAFIAMPTI